MTRTRQHHRRGCLAGCSSCASRSSIHCAPTCSISSPRCSQKNFNRARSRRFMSAVNRTSSSGLTGFSARALAMSGDSKTCASMTASITSANGIDKINPVDTIGATNTGMHPVAKRKTIEQRFWAKVQKGPHPDDCWKWLRAKASGYGKLSADRGRMLRAHIFSYELHFGPVPEGLQVLHSCDNRECTNPRHLEAGTQQKNMQDCFLRGRGNTQRNFGTANGQAVLDAQKVMEIREWSASGVSGNKIAAELRVCRATVQKVLKALTWQHV